MIYSAFLCHLILFFAYCLNSFMLTAAQITYKIDDTRLGRLFDGIGGLSGGGVYFLY